MYFKKITLAALLKRNCRYKGVKRLATVIQVSNISSSDLDVGGQ